MKKILKTIIPIIIIGAIVYQFRSTIFPSSGTFFDRLKNNFTYFFLRPAPCTQPIPYTLGTFDTKFGISQQYFLSALSDAEAIWEKPFGRELFRYNATTKADDALKINLVYDYRQQATSKLSNLGIVVADNRASYDSLKIQFTELKTQLAVAKSDYELSKLEATRVKINNMVDEINALVVVLNRLASTLNISVDKYNTIGASRGESFEEGVYISNGLNSEIDIYEFSSREKLVRVLAHELGHALGLEHVDDPKAIMYKLNQGNNETLTSADLMALKTQCGSSS